MPALLVSADQFYWKSLTRQLEILLCLGMKKDTGELVSLSLTFTIKTILT